MSAPRLYTTLTSVLRDLPLAGGLAGLLAPVTDRIAYLGGYLLGAESDEPGLSGGAARFTLQLVDELVLELQIVENLALIFGAGPVELKVMWEGDSFETYLKVTEVRLRFPREWLSPVVPDPSTSGESVRYLPDEAPTHFVEIDLPLGLRLSGNMDFAPDSLELELIWPGSEAGTLSLPPAMIADTGVIIQVDDIVLRLSGDVELPADGEDLPDDWRGVYFGRVSAQFGANTDARGDDLVFNIENCRIGTDGFSGRASVMFADLLEAELFGFKVKLEQIGLTFEANRLTDGLLKAQMGLPFFDDADEPEHPVSVTAAVGEKGNFTLGLAPAADDASLAELDLTVVKLGLKKFQVDKPAEGQPFVTLTSQLTLDPSSADPLALEIQNLKIYADGKVELPGGWFDVRDKLTFNQSGFLIGITQVGIGLAAEGDNWVGLSGALQLMGDLPAAASVENLRYIWRRGADGRFTVGGVSLGFAVPDAFDFNMRLGFFERGDPMPLNGPPFDTAYLSGLLGELGLQIIPFRLSLNGGFMVGRHYADDPGDATEYLFWLAYLDLDLPVGIPLAQTGISIYGFAGLITQNMRPNKTEDEEWYRDWYKRAPVGATGLNKWRPYDNAFGVGMGATLGTMPDNGYAFALRALLVVSFPGPVIMLAGKANLLTDRSDLADPAKDPLFAFLLVFDALEQSLLFTLEINYKKESILEIGGIAELFFDFDDPDLWHIHVGEKPEERRIRAKIIDLFQANAYFMIDDHSVAFGFFIGFDFHETYGPLEVSLVAYIAADALISWSPQLFSGQLKMAGDIRLAIFGIGLGLALKAALDVAGPKPWIIDALFQVKLDLPWPLPDPEAEIHLHWEEPIPPPFENPLADAKFDYHAALAKADTLPLYASAAEAEDGTLVPMDGVLNLVFNRLVDNRAPGLDAPSQPSTFVVGKDGIQYQFQYGLTQVRLRKVGGTSAELVAVWAPQRPATEDGLQKAVLQVNTHDIFRVDRLVDLSGWTDRDHEFFGGYFCPDAAPSAPQCWYPGDALAGALLAAPLTSRPWQIEAAEGMVGGTGLIPDAELAAVSSRLALAGHAWVEALNARLTLHFSQGAGWIEITAAFIQNIQVEIYRDNTLLGTVTRESKQWQWLTVNTQAEVGNSQPVTAVVLVGPKYILQKVCWQTRREVMRLRFASEQRSFLRAVREQWELPDPTLEPNATYRIIVDLDAERRVVGSGDGPDHDNWSAEYYFRTGAPPADLTPYVQTGIPGDGTTRFFRNYFVDVAFKANHVAIMYEKMSAPLFLQITTAANEPLQASDGHPLVDASGAPSRIPYNPVAGRTRTLTESEDRLVRASGCAGLPPVHSRSSLTLRFAPDSGYLFAPETRYLASLASNAFPSQKLLAFSFTTSRYLDFRDLIQRRVDSFTHHLFHLVDFGFDPKPPLVLSAGQVAEMDRIYAGYGPSEQAGEDALHPSDRAAEHADHERLRTLLAIDPYLPTQGTEIYELRDETRHFGFLIQWAEPVDWMRVRLAGTLTRTEQLASAAVDYPESRFSLVRNADGTAAFLRFPPAVKAVTDTPGWLGDFIDHGTFNPWANLNLPQQIRPLPQIPVPTPRQTLPFSLAATSEPDGTGAPSPVPGVPSALRTLASIIPATLRLVGVGLGLAWNRLLGRISPGTHQVTIQDTQVDLSLALTLCYTRDFSRHPEVSDWPSFQADHPDVPIVGEQSDDDPFENARLDLAIRREGGRV